MKSTYFIEVHYFLKDANRDEFLEKINEAQVAQLSREEKGNIRYDYFIPADDATGKELVLLEEWESEAHQKEHTKTQHFSKIGQLKGIYVENSTVKKCMISAI